MNKSSALHKVVFLMVIILVSLSNFQIGYASVTPQFISLNEANTAIENKYSITGAILKIQKETDSTIVLTMDGLYYIKSGRVKKYTFSGEISNTTSFYKNGQDVYISPLLQTDSKGNTAYVEAKLNLSNGSKKISTNYNDYLEKTRNIWTPDAINTFIDPYKNKWFATYNGGSEKYFALYRIDTAGNIREVASSKDHYDDPFSAYDNLSCDFDNNVYYTYTGGSYNGNSYYIDAQGNRSDVLSILFRVDKNLKKKSFEIYGTIDDYKIGLKGDIWVLSGNKTLIHMDRYGKKLAKIALADGKEISINQNGVVYVLDDNKVKLVYKDKLYTKVTLNSDYRFHEISLISKEDFIVYNENTYELIQGDNKELIVSDAAVKYRPYIVKDNKGNITIFSRNINSQKDTNIKVYKVGSSGITFNDIFMDIGEYDKAIAYDGNIYIPHFDGKYDITINILHSDFKLEKFITVPAVNFIGLHVDSKKNLYVLTNQQLYKVSPSKKIQVVDITDEKGGYQNGIQGFINDKYNNLYVKYMKPDNNANNHEYGLLKINDFPIIKQMKPDTYNVNVDLIFVTSKNEVAIIKDNGTKGTKMYLLDSKGNPVLSTANNVGIYYTPGIISQLERIWKASDGTLFYERYLQIFKRTTSKEVWIANIDQALGDANGTIYYTDYFNLYIYDKQLPKVGSTSPTKSQSKVSLSSIITLQLNEPVKKDTGFKTISISENGSKVSVRGTLINNKIVITPKTKLKSKTKYTVNIPKNSVKDVAGNTLMSDYTYSFTTQ